MKLPLIKLAGYSVCVLALLIWTLLVCLDPYFDGMTKFSPVHSFEMIVLPACLFAIGLLQSRVVTLIIAFLWSVPYGVVMLTTSSIYCLVGAISIVYLICLMLCRYRGLRYW
ncbi:hypothetical protein [Paenibacillus sp. OV219]|uniref:hypothetical protein n=1 Tax=Paenibacillus sp. OV219 TaxID=1884377 RepID=UPI0008B46F2F|nr:hypothetical protein [Paenibacillus sp. OV219]SEO93589.1 hypothetical protein SAMN05518847_11323 [Paenibacillus sp. OV219]